MWLAHVLEWLNYASPCIKILVVLLLCHRADICASESWEPEFVGPMQNVTAARGRDVSLTCAVRNLTPSYSVSWLHVDKSALLAIENQVVSKNPRIRVSNENRANWFLHIENVRQDDEGTYMCQINTVDVKKQYTFVSIQVPPDILDDESSSVVNIEEGSNAQLVCKARGNPLPKITWKREDNRKVPTGTITTTNGRYQGSVLSLEKVRRNDMGTYLCIASNGVPTSVVKRIQLFVHFEPQIIIQHQLVGAPLGGSVTLQCFTEAYPVSMDFWKRDNITLIQNNVVPEGDVGGERRQPEYTVTQQVSKKIWKRVTRLTIHRMTWEHFGDYYCISRNPSGEATGRIRVYNVSAPSKPKTTWKQRPSTPPVEVDRSPTRVNTAGTSTEFKTSMEQQNTDDASQGEESWSKSPFFHPPAMDNDDSAQSNENGWFTSSAKQNIISLVSLASSILIASRILELFLIY